MRTMQECREVIALLTEYLEGDLSAVETRRLEAHLADCTACDGFLASLRTVRVAAGSIKVTSVPAACRKALRAYLKKKLPATKR